MEHFHRLPGVFKAKNARLWKHQCPTDTSRRCLHWNPLECFLPVPVPKIAIYATAKVPLEKIASPSRKDKGVRPESALVSFKICISNSVECKTHNQFMAEHQGFPSLSPLLARMSFSCHQ